MKGKQFARLGVLLILTALVCAGCGTAEQRKARALQRGTEYLAAGNVDKARVELRNAMQLAPNDAEVRYQSGRLAERLGNAREAAQFYQGAIDLAPDHAHARANLARLYLFAAAPERAIEILKPGLERTPKDVAMLVVRASARAQMRNVDGAFQDALTAHEVDPKDPDAISVLAGLCSSNGQPERAKALLEEGIKANPDAVDLRVVLAEYLTRHEDARGAEQQLREVIRRKPGDAGVRIQLARLLAATEQVAPAEEVLRTAIHDLPKEAGLKEALVAFLAARRGRDAARDELLRQVRAGGDDPAPRFELARFYQEGKELPAAEAVYKELIDRQGTRPQGLTARVRLAVLRVQQGDRKNAEALVDEVLKASPRDDDALTLRADLRLTAGDVKAAIADLRAVLRDQPNSIPLQRALARAHIANGEPALAEETLRRALEASPTDPGVRIDLGEVLLASGKADQSMPLFESVAKERPDDLAAESAVFRAAMATGDVATAKTAAQAVVKAQPKDPLGYFEEGALAEREQRTEDAVRSYDKALELKPDGAEALDSVVRVLVGAKRTPEALRRLDATAAQFPSSPYPLNLKATVLLAQGRTDEAQAATTAALEREPKWWVPYRTLSAIAAARRDLPGAVKALQDGVANSSEPIRLRLELAQLYDHLGRVEEAIGEYEQMLKLDPRSSAVANNLAMLLASHRSDAASLKRAADLAAPFASSENPLFLDTYGWIKLKQGDAAGAVPSLDRAVALAPKLPELRYHLALAQLGAGQSVIAKQNLSQLLSDGRSFPGIDDARAELKKLERLP